MRCTLSASDLHITPGRDSTDFTYLEARVHGELELLDIVRKDEGLELLGATYSGMTDVIKGTQFDPGVPQDARLAERFLKLVPDCLVRATPTIRVWADSMPYCV